MLRLSPNAVWAMTPREAALALAAAAGRRAHPFGRRDLEALMRAHPDEER